MVALHRKQITMLAGGIILYENNNIYPALVYYNVKIPLFHIVVLFSTYHVFNRTKLSLAM